MNWKRLLAYIITGSGTGPPLQSVGNLESQMSLLAIRGTTKFLRKHSQDDIIQHQNRG